MGESYDGVILGTGHNALVLHAYLARAGVRALSLDRADVAGGGLATVDHPGRPGFRQNVHSFFHRALTEMPWYRDLELRRHGAEYLEPELNVALVLPDGRSLQWWTDPEKTARSFAEFSKKDADALRRWTDAFRPVVEKILVPEAQSPPLPPDRRRALLERSAPGRMLLEVSALSPLDFVRREFEHDTVRAGLLFFNGLREVDLRLPGMGHSIPSLLASRAKAQMCVGGSARLAEALVRDIREHGGDVRTGAEPKSILVRNGRACGVELVDGERIEASFVASGLNPQQTFLSLLDADAVSPETRGRAERFRYNLIAPLFGLYLALNEPPRYGSFEADRAFMVILGLERFDQFTEIVEAHEQGKIPAPVMWGACPTLFDRTQAPAGKHTAFMWEKLPYALNGDPRSWDSAKDGHGRKMLEVWTRFAPNLEGAVIDSFTRSPLDTERTLPNMQGGDLLVGSFSDGQIGFHRPFAGAGEYRTPLPGLYLCGGSSHPGGNVTGLCGYNAASVVAADLGAPLWWNPPQVERAWSELLTDPV